MIYLGSKLRIAKSILPIILHGREDGQYFVELFVGGANITSLVANPRMANDINQAVVTTLAAIRDGWIPPTSISYEEYYTAKRELPDTDPLKAFIAITCSFGARWWGSYARSTKGGGVRSYAEVAHRNALAQAPTLQGVEFYFGDYRALPIPPRSIIYCDPPYKEVFGYEMKFDYPAFYEWCIAQHSAGHRVYISELQMPPPFIPIWTKKLTVHIKNCHPSGERVERLFTLGEMK